MLEEKVNNFSKNNNTVSKKEFSDILTHYTFIFLGSNPLYKFYQLCLRTKELNRIKSIIHNSSKSDIFSMEIELLILFMFIYFLFLKNNNYTQEIIDLYHEGIYSMLSVVNRIKDQEDINKFDKIIRYRYDEYTKLIDESEKNKSYNNFAKSIIRNTFNFESNETVNKYTNYILIITSITTMMEFLRDKIKMKYSVV